jgi:hypothetical protein
MVVNSSDGPLLLTRWRCAANHWWHMTTDASPVSATEAHCGSSDWLANEIALAIAFSRISEPEAGEGDPRPG